MLEQQTTFGEALAAWMHVRGVSTKRLAELTGYRSKTSIVRILREESVHAGRERLFARMDSLGMLSPDDRRSLARGLELSRVGRQRSQDRRRLRGLLMGQGGGGLSPALDQALEPLRQARAARILMVNACQAEVSATLREILRRHPAHTMEHFVTIDLSAPQPMEALCAVLSIACAPTYACAIREAAPGAREGLRAQDILCFSAQDRDGGSEDTLVIFSGDGGVCVHTQPSSFGLFDYLRRAIGVDGFEPAVSAHFMQEGPESIVEAMRFCTELERGCGERTVKPDVCINEVAGGILRSALLDGGVLRCFPGWTERQMRAQLEEFFYYHDQRYHNAFDDAHRRGRIMSPRSLRRFALTGRFDSPFPAIRPFTVEERIAILENFALHMRRNGENALRFWDAEGELAMEVHCFENVGIIAFPAREAGGLNVNFQTSILRHPRLAALFQECFDDDLLRNCTMPGQEALLYIDGLLNELRAAP